MPALKPLHQFKAFCKDHHVATVKLFKKDAELAGNEGMEFTGKTLYHVLDEPLWGLKDRDSTHPHPVELAPAIQTALKNNNLNLDDFKAVVELHDDAVKKANQITGKEFMPYYVEKMK